VTFPRLNNQDNPWASRTIQDKYWREGAPNAERQPTDPTRINQPCGCSTLAASGKLDPSAAPEAREFYMEWHSLVWDTAGPRRVRPRISKWKRRQKAKIWE